MMKFGFNCRAPGKVCSQWFSPARWFAGLLRSCGHGRRLLAILLLASLPSLGINLRGAEPSEKEQSIRAAFIYNFTKFVEWPAGKLPDAKAPIIIGVVGQDPFGQLIADAIEGRQVNGRELRLQRINTVKEVRELHVLFVNDRDLSKLSGLAEELAAGGVLGVGESEAFLDLGGAIRFVLEGDKVRFEINAEAAEHGRLKISSQLQKLARPRKKQS